jgi:putative thioredoxin
MTAIVATGANFDDVVLRASATRPVLVDFWAPWCAPCRALAPILERLAAELGGRFALAKVNVDNEPELAARYRVRGIPDCRLFVNGAVTDEFTGALPERALRDFLARALPSAAAPLIAAAKVLLANGDAAGALAKLDEAHALDPHDADLALTRGDALVAANRIADAQAVVSELERARRPTDERRLAALKARIALAGDANVDLAALAEAAARTPVDCAAKLAYARATAARGDYERALAEALAIVRTDRNFGDDAGRRMMLAIFDALPADSDLVRRYRRELAAAIN